MPLRRPLISLAFSCTPLSQSPLVKKDSRADDNLAIISTDAKTFRSVWREKSMHNIIILSQLIIALGICNVWLIRANRATNYRGGNARTMEEEFHVYGLSTTCMKIVRVCKLLSAALLISGVWIPALTRVGAISMAVLMVAAVLMHAKVRDPIRKAVPAASLLLLSVIVAVFAGA